MSSYPTLVRVPRVEPFEAVSAWLCRLALSQGVSPVDICDYLEVGRSGDVDMQFFGDNLVRLRNLCGLPDDAFHVQDRVITSLVKAGAPSKILLAREDPRFMRYRYCVCCLAEMHTPHYPIHWRFVAWRWCPIHDCLMESECRKCKSSVLLLRDLAVGGRSRRGLGSLSRCLNCGDRLTARKPCTISDLPSDALTAWEQMQLSNGRALLAALYYGKFSYLGQHGSKSMASLGRAIRKVAISTKFDFISADSVRKRTESKC